MNNDLIMKLKGTVTHFETDLDNNEIEGTRVEDHNSIGDDLKKYLAHSIGDTVDEALDDFFTTSAVTLNKDGIALYSPGLLALTSAFITTLNVGGDGTVSYVEFYGYAEGAISLIGDLQLGYKADATPQFTSVFASYAINKSVDADRKYHFYWKITIG